MDEKTLAAKERRAEAKERILEVQAKQSKVIELRMLLAQAESELSTCLNNFFWRLQVLIPNESSEEPTSDR